LSPAGRSGADFAPALLRKGGEAVSASRCARHAGGQDHHRLLRRSGQGAGAFIIANGAAAMGRPVTMFFTFWGLTALRKSRKAGREKDAHGGHVRQDAAPGHRKLKLSRMNMGGMGTEMMKKS
jgi:hypothetical protein